MSNPGLRFEIAEPQAAHRLNREKIQFVGVSATADPTDRFQTINREAALIFIDEGLVSCFLGPARDLVDSVIPRDVVPMIRARPADSEGMNG